MDLEGIKQRFSLRDLYNCVSQEKMIQRYFGDYPKYNRKYRNPFRDDKHASGWFWQAADGIIYFIDPATSKRSFTALDLAAVYYDCDLDAALQFVLRDFAVGQNMITGPQGTVELKERSSEFKENLDIKWEERKFTQRDLDWWNQFNIDEKLLKEYTIAIDKYWTEGKLGYLYNELDPAYGYPQGDWIKIYRPKSSKKNRFKNNYSNIVLEGWQQLQDTDDLCIVSKSTKDIMSLKSIGYTSVACRSESTFPTIVQIAELNSRFSKIVIFFDNDSAGIENSDKLSLITGWGNYRLPQGSKDPSDFIKNNGPQKLKDLLYETIKN